MSASVRYGTIGAIVGAMLIGGYLLYDSMRPPYEKDPIHPDLFQIDHWNVDGTEHDAFPASVKAASRVSVQLVGRPTRPNELQASLIGGSPPESVLMLLFAPSKPDQPGGTILLSESSPVSASKTTEVSIPVGVVHTVEHRATAKSKPADSNRIRTYSGVFATPKTPGSYVLLVGVGAGYGTLKPENGMRPDRLAIVEKIPISVD
jgi:hypothetical protein